MTIRRMQAADINAVVNIHLSSFQGFFLSFLGKRFLCELYAAIIEDKTGIGLVNENLSQLTGFVAGTDSPQGFYQRLLRQRWWRFAWAALWPALRKPSIIPRLLRAFSRGQSEDIHTDCATIMSIAVAPETQGQGVGQALVREYLREAARRGVKRVNLTTDQLENEATNRFYQKMGFRLNQSFVTPEGRMMNEYVIDV